MLGVLAGLGCDGAIDPDTAVLRVHMRLVGLLHSQLTLCKEIRERRRVGGREVQEGKEQEQTVIPLGAVKM